MNFDAIVLLGGWGVLILFAWLALEFPGAYDQQNNG